MDKEQILAGWTILVVEDDFDAKEIIEVLLTLYGGTVITAANGQEGLEMAAEFRPVFIISDLSMPVMNGWEMIRQLKRNVVTKDIPVIALTAAEQVGDREKALSKGFHNYLTKPLAASTFLRDVLKLLDGIRDTQIINALDSLDTHEP